MCSTSLSTCFCRADALALAADILRNPAFPASQFEQLRLQAVTGSEFQRNEPGAVAGIALARYFDPWPKGHPLHVDSLDESLDKLKGLRLEDVAAYHRDFYGTGEGEIIATLDGASLSLDFVEYWHDPHKHILYNGTKT